MLLHTETENSDYVEVKLKHHPPIEFLAAEGVAPTDILRRMNAMSGEHAWTEVPSYDVYVAVEWTIQARRVYVNSPTVVNLRPDTVQSRQNVSMD